MRSLSGNRPAQAMSIWRRWERLSGMTDKAATRRANEALGELAILCAPEIAQAFNEFKGSSSLLISDPELLVREVAEVGVRKAAQTLRDEPGRLLLDHVKDCVTSVLKDAEAAQREELRNLAPDQLLDMVLRLARSDAASLLNCASFDQCSGLVVELVRRRSVKSGGLSLDVENEPEDDLSWLLWYIFRLHAEEASARGLLEDKAHRTRVVLLVDPSGDTGPQPRNKHGEPINLAGPILVKVFDKLTGLSNNQMPAPARTNLRLGRTFGIDPDVVARWKRHPEWRDLRVNTEPDGEGGLHYTFDLEALLRSARIVTGHKRGPNPQPAS
jgi:hypothetical protein